MDELLYHILVALCRKDTWHQYSDVLSPDIFTNSTVQAVHAHLTDLHEIAPDDVTPAMLRLDIQAAYANKPDRADELLEVVTNMDTIDPVPQEVLEHYVRKFVEREIAYKTAWYITNHADSDDFDVGHAADLLERAVDTGSLIDAQVTSIVDAAVSTGDDRVSVCSLGLSDKLDSILHGGVGAGELLVFLAPPARGKTSFLWEVTTSAARQGKNALGITLEISASKCVRRIDQSLTKLSSDEMVTARSAVKSARKQLAGELWIKDWSYKGTTTDDIKALVKRMRKNGQPVDFLMVDYLELVRPTTFNRNSERHNYARVAQDMRALAVELQIPVVTAWQVNRAGSDQWLLGEKDISECWDVIKIADIILGLNQTATDKQEQLMRVNVIKQREGTARPQVPLYCDLDRMDIHEAGETDGDEDPENMEDRD